MDIEIIINGVISGLLTGFGAAVGSYIAAEHLIKKIPEMKKNRRD